jgi:hypothetical protein
MVDPLVADGGAQTANTTLLILGAGFLVWIAVRRLQGRALTRFPRWTGWIGVGVAFVLAALALVLPSVVSPGPRSTRPRSTASIRIVQPTEGQVFPAPGQVPVRIVLRGGRIVPATTTRLAPDEGHIHLFLDGALVSMTGGTSTSITAGPGTHVLMAEFVASDHGPFDPRVSATTRFTVQG